MTEPPSKKLKGEEFTDLVNQCYDLKFNLKTIDEQDLKSGIQKIRETLEGALEGSSDISFGASKTTAKINWGKCMALLLEDGHHSFGAIKVLTGKLSPGGGLM